MSSKPIEDLTATAASWRKRDIFIKAEPLPARAPAEIRDWGTSGRNPNRCLRHDDGKVRLDMIPIRPLWEIARVYEYGAKKYEMNNWRKGTSWSRCFAACLRHLWKWWGGEDIDPESRISHLAHAAFWVFAFIEWTATHPEHDDRPRTVGEREAELEIDEAFGRIIHPHTAEVVFPRDRVNIDPDTGFVTLKPSAP